MTLKYNDFNVQEDLKYTNINVNVASQNHNTNTQTVNASFSSIAGEDANAFCKFFLVLLDKFTGKNLLYSSVAFFFIYVGYMQTDRLLCIIEKYVVKDSSSISSCDSKCNLQSDKAGAISAGQPSSVTTSKP